MIEKVILDYLKERISVPVYMEKSESPPDRYVLIEKTGGARRNHINSATMALQSYAESLFYAAKLNEEVKVAMDNIIVLDAISRVEYNTDYNYSDTTKKKYRYQAIYDVTF